ncbi:bifunctional phosphopantothenoylcysteine decarboxylase/phosphopantothenate--cysteine ligase CoaBC [Robbsia sp. Bb-Pol-6]|uniref:Coenzyme A biosynthesis bifunctional protein CoaBC n=1 Tax=Robbsia betulipollinis TaxID=2981849 RepID=A0ABT3ZQT0_9BURK|nr:bifunctional phosphopantothenoylcysteine decarboxylase/phosphopantothenate--cysteine ligase CoaBC [Robbsia betulipollinis]MCY0388777.1 bifunctional phosphopantothenoylcysteine decarboxylase/phosphopantothenate--cysteine ligase CoaBC [Robbsia betulipollinis]
MNPPLPRDAGALAGRHLVLGLTGGIACYKTAELARLLVKAGATVQVAMTAAAARFITPLTMQALTGRPVQLDEWAEQDGNGMAHIDLSRRADAIVIAPASADFLARLAHGHADDLLATLCIARDCPLSVVPAMNRQMWSNPATQRNVAQLRADGVTVLGPAAGEQACGEVGEGRMLEPRQICDALVASFQPQRLAGRRVVITAGPTFEPIDPVRGITNRSSGKMGYAIARAAAEAGARVDLISGPTALPVPWGVTRTDVETAAQMRAAVLAAVHGANLFVAVAAVADWRPAVPHAEKIKRRTNGPPAIDFTENPDILAEVAALPGGPYCVGFAAETQHLEAHAQAKRRSKNVPLIVGNLGHLTFGKDDNEIVLFDAAGAHPLPAGDKLTLARVLVAEIARRLDASSSASSVPFSHEA